MFPQCSFSNSDKYFLIYGFLINYKLSLLRVGFLSPQSLKQYKGNFRTLRIKVLPGFCLNISWFLKQCAQGLERLQSLQMQGQLLHQLS